MLRSALTQRLRGEQPVRPFPGCISESSLSRTSGGAGTHVTRFSMQVREEQPVGMISYASSCKVLMPRSVH